jgi:Flp pilus assembly pilin Flp
MLILTSLQRLWADRAGQDFVEYALLAAAVAVAVGAIFPPTVMSSVSIIMSKVGSVVTVAGGG